MIIRVCKARGTVKYMYISCINDYLFALIPEDTLPAVPPLPKMGLGNAGDAAALTCAPHVSSQVKSGMWRCYIYNIILLNILRFLGTLYIYI